MFYTCTIYLNIWKMFAARQILTIFTGFSVVKMLLNFMSANVHRLCLLLVF